MRAAAIGDNCIDMYVYIDKQKVNRKYPTGNAVDTGVNLHKLGVPTAIISTTGSDEDGKWMIDTLTRIGLDVSHLKVGQGATAITYMDMNGNDRVHGDYVEGVLENIVFDESDIAFAASHDLVHTALWGKAESVLPAIKAQKNAPLISFDYADRLDHPLVESTLPYVDYGFYSYHKKRDSFIEAFLQDKVARGMQVAVATFGEDGSLAWDGKQFWQFGIFKAPRVVNTVGAGDSFIAGFLYGVLNGMPIKDCLKEGAKIAAEVVQVFEPWTDA
ncbi:MAG: fructoselysine 6-kinase [Oscillospiraceae bacterium]|nr:fructoselysine 6-kinase [Oscillospiraceae bacterium]